MVQIASWFDAVPGGPRLVVLAGGGFASSRDDIVRRNMVGGI
jgi:hypothetical protein